MNNRRGFTLIELLVAATIIALLTTIGIVSFTTTNQRARDGKRRADIEQVRAALELYRSDDSAGAGKYPAGNNFSTTLNSLKGAKYISDPLPQDPKNVSPYTYLYTANGTQTGYCMCALLEGTNNANSPDSTCNNIASGQTPYYCVTNP